MFLCPTAFKSRLQRLLCVVLLGLAVTGRGDEAPAYDEASELRRQIQENRHNITRIAAEQTELEASLAALDPRRREAAVSHEMASRQLAETVDLGRARKDSADFEQRYHEQLEQARIAGAEVAALQREARALEDDIALARSLQRNIARHIALQRSALHTLQRGSEPSALDSALRRAVASRQQGADGPGAVREQTARLRGLLMEIMRGDDPEQRRFEMRSGQNPEAARRRLAAQNEYHRLLALFEDLDPERRDPKKLVLEGNLEGELAWRSDHVLSYLGHGQYHLEVALPAGALSLEVDNIHWHKTVTADEGDTEFVIIYDAADMHAPRLTAFPRWLLEAAVQSEAGE